MTQDERWQAKYNEMKDTYGSLLMATKGSWLMEIEAGGKEYLRTDGYDRNGCHRL
jgi:hypothetical protein